MGQIATIDFGNSSAKLVIYDRDTGLECHCATLGRDGLRKSLRDRLDGRRLDGIIGCSVGAGPACRDISFGCPVIEFTSETPTPLTVRYNRNTLGADRLAAAVGAYSLHAGSELLVADLGTACTYDIVSADGCFMGGNIAPGPGMRLRALNNFTARLPLVSGHGDIVSPGQTTEQALRSGALLGVVAELLYYSADTGRRQLILTGGWAPEVARLLPCGISCEIHPHLVNQGLNTIMNEILPR